MLKLKIHIFETSCDKNLQLSRMKYTFDLQDITQNPSEELYTHTHIHSAR